MRLFYGLMILFSILGGIFLPIIVSSWMDNEPLDTGLYIISSIMGLLVGLFFWSLLLLLVVFAGFLISLPKKIKKWWKSKPINVREELKDFGELVVEVFNEGATIEKEK